MDHARKLNCRNPVLLEKAIIALQVVANLVENRLPFQFKGGTSLLLRLNPIRRLSIDIDIVTQATPEEILSILQRVTDLPPLTSFKHDVIRDRDLPPKKHFKIFYPSQIETKTDHVLLDILFETSNTSRSEAVLIDTPFIMPDRKVLVNMPSINALLAEKLTAFAPYTIGILYDIKRSTDIVKQLFDIGALFDVVSDLNEIKSSYEAVHALQCKYRERNYSLKDTLLDSINAGFKYSQIDLKGGIESEIGTLIKKGIGSLQTHLTAFDFSRDQVFMVGAWCFF
jgi:predicted nucleotidyltransferase component of viral defense system